MQDTPLKDRIKFPMPMRYQFGAQAPTGAGKARHHGINSVCRGAGHQANNELRGVCGSDLLRWGEHERSVRKGSSANKIPRAAGRDA